MRNVEDGPINPKDVYKAEQAVNTQLRKQFGLFDGSDDQRVTARLIDRTRYSTPRYFPMPHSTRCQRPEDYMEVVRTAIDNLHTAASEARRELDCYRRIYERDQERERLRSALRKLFVGWDFGFEPNSGFMEGKPQWHYWGWPETKELRRYSFGAGADYSEQHLKPFLAFVRQARKELLTKHRKQIQGFVVSIGSWSGCVVALVNMTEKEIVDAQVRIEARKRVLAAEEAKVRAEKKV